MECKCRAVILEIGTWKRKRPKIKTLKLWNVFQGIPAKDWYAYARVPADRQEECLA